MDTFLEYLVKKKPDNKTVAKKALIILGVIVLSVILFILSAAVRALSFIFICAIMGAIYGAWFLSTSLNLEFEYIVTNGDMDVDKIVAKRKRRRVISIKFREIEVMAKVNGEHKREFDNHSVKTFLDVSASPLADDAYFLITRNSKMGLTRVIFTPDERIINSAHKFAPLKVHTD